jgi:hypothetical protein
VKAGDLRPGDYYFVDDTPDTRLRKLNHEIVNFHRMDPGGMAVVGVMATDTEQRLAPRHLLPMPQSRLKLMELDPEGRQRT